MAARSVFVGGTSSHAGKSWMCTAICAWLRRRGVRVAPFKAQNMSNNSYPCLDGGEIGRAQVAQAMACGLEPEPAMNPILLKPNSSTGSQVVVNGRVWRTLPARGYYEHFDELLSIVLDAYDRLSRRFEFVVIEGAGSVCELNLRPYDLVNFGLATRIQSPALLVSDIERGGVFASILGSIGLLEQNERALLRSFAVNKFRGDLSLFDEGRRILEQRSGIPCLGVFPYAADIDVDDEDSLSVPEANAAVDAQARYAIIRFPRISNSTDWRLIPAPVWIDRTINHRFDVIFLPGTKNTMADLEWLRARGLEPWLREQAAQGARIVGICGGYQMLGEVIRDPEHVESNADEVAGLGLLPVETTMAREKTVRRVRACTTEGVEVDSYEIHMGLSQMLKPAAPAFRLEDGSEEGIRCGGIIGTYLHGALESAELLRVVLGIEAATAESKQQSFHQLADWFNAYGSRFADLYLA